MGFTPAEQPDSTPVQPIQAKPTPDQAPDSPQIQEAPAEPTPSVPAFKLPEMTSTPVEESAPVDTLITAPLKGDDFDFVLPDEDTQKRIQKALADLDLYPGKQNGKWGDLTIAAIQQSVSLKATREPDQDLVQAIRRATDIEPEGDLDQAVWEDFAQSLENR